MGYITDMRKLVGHQTLLFVGASVIVENEKGEILLQKRKDNHCYGYAGGCVELDEKVEDAARRELFEETGLIAGELKLFGVFSGKEQHYTYPNGDDACVIDIVYRCTDYKGELRMQENEVESLFFCRVDQIPEKISPPIVSVIKRYIEVRKEEGTY